MTRDDVNSLRESDMGDMGHSGHQTGTLHWDTLQPDMATFLHKLHK